MAHLLRKTSHVNLRESQQQLCHLGKCCSRKERNNVDSNMSMLQMANASVSWIRQPHSAVTMCILFDSGSQLSYISE